MTYTRDHLHSPEEHEASVSGCSTCGRSLYRLAVLECTETGCGARCCSSECMQEHYAEVHYHDGKYA